MTKKEIIEVLKENIKITKKELKNNHSEEMKNELKGLKAGYEFSIILLKK